MLAEAWQIRRGHTGSLYVRTVDPHIQKEMSEVWLVTGAGALFAAFPNVYATVFSGFYDAFMLLLFVLIFRAVAIEVRGQRPQSGWRATWDVAFAISSMASAFLIGVAMGNTVWGIPLDDKYDFQGNFLTLLHPYSLFVGIKTVALFAMHTNLYLILKTDGPLQQQLIGWTRCTVPIYLICFVVLNAFTILKCPHIGVALHQRPLLLGVLFIASLLVTFTAQREAKKGHEG